MEKKARLGEIGKNSFILLTAALFLGCFVSQGIYAAVARYASLIAFAAFSALFFSHRNPFLCLLEKDVEFLLMAAADLLTLINLFVIRSNKGAFLTVVNLLLAVYLADKVHFSKKQAEALSGCGAVFLIPWFGFVKWEYNFNMAGLVFMLISILGILFLAFVKEEYGFSYLIWIQAMLYAAGTLYTILYHSRCAMVGMLLFGLFLPGGRLFQKYKALRRIFIILATAGSIFFTLFYVWLGSLSVDITFLYKSILSGREEIWSELWQALLAKPVTGIGSSYQMKSFFIFEVHNGLFDILAVHGIPVFLVTLFLLIHKMWKSSPDLEHSEAERIADAGMLAILFVSYFENFFIVPPYLLIFFFFFTLTARTGEHLK